MQNTMLDSVVSSNSQELFDFNAVHNGEACIESLRPEDRGTERQFWFTIAMLVVIFDEQRRTIERNIESLIEDQEVSDKNVRDASVLDINGVPHKTTIYNLEVLNKLGMCCFRGNKKAKEIRNKFSDVLVEHETGGYGIRTVDDMINDPDTAIRLLTQLKILRLQNDQLSMERDEAIRTKAMIGSRREATAAASVKSRECAKLTTEDGELKDAVGRGTNWRTVSMMKAEWKREFGHAPDWHKLKQFSEDVGIRPIRDVEEKVILHNGSVKTNTVFRYHREAWAKYREYEENLHVPDKNVRDAKILDLRAADIEIEYF